MNRFRTKMALFEHQWVVANLNLDCPFCSTKLNTPELMLGHLIQEHDMGLYQAQFLAQKSFGLKREDSAAVKFPRMVYRARNPKSGRRSKQVYY
jgi:hypothetical protein